MVNSIIKIIVTNKLLYWVYLGLLSIGLLYSILHEKGDLIMYLNANREDYYDWFNVYFTYLGEAVVFILVAIILLFKRYSWSLGVGLVGLSSLLVSSTLKTIFAERRPWRWLGENNMHGLVEYIHGNDFHVGLSSFPSGHTMAAFGLYTYLALLFPKYKFVFVVTAVLVGFSRLYLMQHFIEDVIMGASLGVVLGTLSFLVTANLEGKWLGRIKRSRA